MLKVKSRIWIETDHGILLGNGRVRLLKAIIEFGSLNKAAKATEMSYKKAWKLLDSLNQNAPQPIVITNKGGAKGGGTGVTEYGMELIAAFEKANKNVQQLCNQEQAQLN